MLQVTRSPMMPETTLGEASPPALGARTIKRGFKANSGAGFLRKRHSIEKKPETPEIIQNPSSEQETMDLKKTVSCIVNPTIYEPLIMNEDGKSCISQKRIRAMIIGERGSGKRNFIKSLFCNDPEINFPEKQCFDFFTKSVVDGHQNTRYDFWIKESSCERPKAHQLIIDVYSKSCSVFFLMHNPDDEFSLASLESELYLLKNANINKDKCIVVLLSHKRQQGSCSNKQKQDFKGWRQFEHLTENNEEILKMVHQLPAQTYEYIIGSFQEI